MATDIRMSRTDETFRLNVRGETERVYRVSFFVNDQGPFTLDFKPADFTQDRVKQEVAKFAETVVGIGF